MSDGDSILGANLSFTGKSMGESNANKTMSKPKYEKADLPTIAPDCENLSPVKKAKLLEVLMKCVECFHGN